MAYITKLTLYLGLSYIFQSWLYLQWAPRELAWEVIIALGISLSLLTLGFMFFNHHHQVIFHPHHLEVRFDLINYHKEFLYRDIQWIEMTNSKHGYGTLVLTARDHDQVKLFYLDDIFQVKQFIEQRQQARAIA